MASPDNSSQKNESPDQAEINKWYENGEWLGGLQLTPDASINREEFFIQYNRRKDLWDKAFEYLKTQDLNGLQVGSYKIEGDNLFAVVTEYMTRSLDESKYEAHKKYADIQYLISGEENMGIAPLNKTKVTIPYDESKDLVFLEAPDENLRLANNKRFFIFFPDDAHRPCMMIDKKTPIKKIVLKVRVD